MSSSSSEHQQKSSLSVGEQPNLITSIRLEDVVLGRGLSANKHPGNLMFRKMIQERKDEYSSSSRRKFKDDIAKEIFFVFQSMGVRFVREIKTFDEASHLGLPYPLKSKIWLIADDDTIIQKIKQALREIGTGTTTSTKTQSASAITLQETKRRHSDINDPEMLSLHVQSSACLSGSSYPPDVNATIHGFSPKGSLKHEYDEIGTERICVSNRTTMPDEYIPSSNSLLERILSKVQNEPTGSTPIGSKSALESMLLQSAFPAVGPRYNQNQNTATSLVSELMKLKSQQFTNQDTLNNIFPWQRPSPPLQLPAQVNNPSSSIVQSYGTNNPNWHDDRQQLLILRLAEMLSSSNVRQPSIASRIPNVDSTFEQVNRYNNFLRLGLNDSLESDRSVPSLNRNQSIDSSDQQHILHSLFRQQMEDNSPIRAWTNSTPRQTTFARDGQLDINLLEHLMASGDINLLALAAQQQSSSGVDDDRKPSAKDQT